MCVIVRGLQVGPALVLAPGSLWCLWLGLPSVRLPLGCGLFLPVLPRLILHAGSLGFRLSCIVVTSTLCLGFLMGLLWPFGVQKFMELFLGGEIPAGREGGKRRMVQSYL